MIRLRKLLFSTVIMLAVVPAAESAGAIKLYKWVDSQGIVHYGDSVPPEFSKTDRHILNEQAIAVGLLPAEKTAEQRESDKRTQAIEEAEQRQIEQAYERDKVLLSTYLSINEIQALRNRRKELLEGQIRVTQVYLMNLREKLTKLQEDASHFQPYNPDSNAPPIHDWLAKELANTLNSILVYEQTLIDTRDQKNELVAKFDSDIDRFRLLKGLD
jgi:hypothetical protein